MIKANEGEKDSKIAESSKKPWAPRGKPYRGGLVPVRFSGGDPYENDRSVTK